MHIGELHLSFTSVVAYYRCLLRKSGINMYILLYTYSYVIIMPTFTITECVIYYYWHKSQSGQTGYILVYPSLASLCIYLCSYACNIVIYRYSPLLQVLPLLSLLVLIYSMISDTNYGPPIYTLEMELRNYRNMIRLSEVATRVEEQLSLAPTLPIA